MALVTAFTGPSNGGKTTLISKIVKKLTPAYDILVVKNDPKDKAQFDIKGKDSYIFFNSGAEVAVVSPKRMTYFSNKKWDILDLINISKFDLVLIEGLKYLDFPRIAVFRGELDKSYFPYIKAVAVDESINKSEIPSNIDVLDLNNEDEVIEWIFKNAKEIK